MRAIPLFVVPLSFLLIESLPIIISVALSDHARLHILQVSTDGRLSVILFAILPTEIGHCMFLDKSEQLLFAAGRLQARLSLILTIGPHKFQRYSH